MHNATLESQDYRQLLFGTSHNGLLYQFSRLQEIFEDYSDRILRKPYIDLSTEQNKVLMTLAMHERLRLAELQAYTAIENTELLDAVGILISRKLVTFAQPGKPGDNDPDLQLSPEGKDVLDRMRRLLQKADDIMFTELREARKTTLHESVQTFADRLRMHAN